jgi:hypothetical protein
VGKPSSCRAPTRWNHFECWGAEELEVDRQGCQCHDGAWPPQSRPQESLQDLEQESEKSALPARAFPSPHRPPTPHPPWSPRAAKMNAFTPWHPINLRRPCEETGRRGGSQAAASRRGPRSPSPACACTVAARRCAQVLNYEWIFPRNNCTHYCPPPPRPGHVRLPPRGCGHRFGCFNSARSL